MSNERDERNKDFERISDALQRALAQGHYERAVDALKGGDVPEWTREMAQAGLIVIREQPMTMRERIIYAPPLVKVGCAMTALGLCCIAANILTR